MIQYFCFVNADYSVPFSTHCEIQILFGWDKQQRQIKCSRFLTLICKNEKSELVNSGFDVYVFILKDFIIEDNISGFIFGLVVEHDQGTEIHRKQQHKVSI